MPSALILLSSTPSSTKLAPGAKLQDVDTYHTVVRCSIAPRLKVHREFYAKIIPPSAPKITIKRGGARHAVNNTNPIRASIRSPEDATELTHKGL